MSLFFGSRQKSKPQYSSLQVQSSANNLPLPLAWGLLRLAPNLIWYGDFKSHKQSAGGKGGGGKGGSQYTYSASVAMALCQGVSAGILRVFRDNEKNATLASLGLTFFDGSDPQSPWGYLLSAHPSDALSYAGTVYVAKANYDLGNTAALPQHSFETKARGYNTQVGGSGDSDPTNCIIELLTLPVGGAGFPSADIDMDSVLSGPDAPTTGDTAIQTYYRASGFGLSPGLVTQEQATDVLDRWCKILNTAIVWNGAALKFVPYALEDITGNGVTFVSILSAGPIYTLTDDDYISETEDPVIITRRDPSTVKNRLQMEILNRAKEYNAVPVEWVDQALYDQFGEQQDAVFNAHEVCDMAMATKLVTIMGQRNAYRGNNQYAFTTGPAFCLVEPMDILQIVDPILGTIEVQVDHIEEDEDGNLEFDCSQVLVGSTDSTGFTPPDQTPTGNDTGVDPGSVNPPIFIEPTSLLAGSQAQVWVAVSGGDGTTADPNWGGCFVHVSTDDATYIQIGEITEPARMGKTTTSLAAYASANPDTAHTVGVDLSMSGGELISVSSGDASRASTVSFLGGELLSYMNAVLTTTSHYTLGGELYRALYGTTAPLHASGVDFARLDDAIFKYVLPSQYIGQTLYFKFQSYNVFGGGLQDLADCVAYIYTPSGSGYGTGTNGGPTTPIGFSGSAGAGFAKLTWNANPAADNVTAYEIWRATGSSQPFGSATRIGSTVGTEFTDTSGTWGQVYTYFLVAVNAIGSSAPTAGINLTATTPTLSNQPYGFAFGPKTPVALKILATFDTPIAWTLPASLTNSQARIVDSDTATAAAPSADTDFDIQYPLGTSIGTMRFASGSFTATFINTVADAVPIGGTTYLIAPSDLHGITGAITGSILGTR